MTNVEARLPTCRETALFGIGCMGPMTMPFLIKDEKALNAMRPGNQIKATLVVTDDGGQWLENVVMTSKAGAS